MTIADVLRADGRFSRLRDLAEQTRTARRGEPSWLETWDSPAQTIGEDFGGVTVFAPTDAAFAALDPAPREQLESGQLDNGARYQLLAAHFVPQRYPQAAFEDGPAPVFQGDVELSLDPPTFGGHAITQPDLTTANGISTSSTGWPCPPRSLRPAGRRPDAGVRMLVGRGSDSARTLSKRLGLGHPGPPRVDGRLSSACDVRLDRNDGVSVVEVFDRVHADRARSGDASATSSTNTTRRRADHTPAGRTSDPACANALFV